MRLLLVTVDFPRAYAAALPGLGIETHVFLPLAELEGAPALPTQAWVHRERHWSTTGLAKAVAVARRERIDAVLTAAPSVHVIGASVRLLTGARWIADVRGSSGTVLGSLVARQADAVVSTGDDAEAVAEAVQLLGRLGSRPGRSAS